METETEKISREKAQEAQKRDGCYIKQSPPTWRDRLRWKFFPIDYAQAPEAPAHFKDVLCQDSTWVVDWKDRIRILLTGRVRIESRAACENVIGKTKGSITINVLPWKFMEWKP